MLSDYHVHSIFSDDSDELVENQINAAIKKNLKEICFTDHVDYGVKNDWCEGIKYRDDGTLCMNVDYDTYFNQLDKYKNGLINVKKGLEFGMQKHTIDQFQALFNKYKDELDFILLSIHQVDDLEFWNQEFQKGKTQKEYNEKYYDEMYHLVCNYHDYSVLAHMDLLARYDMRGEYPFELIEDKIVSILKKVISDGKGIEINTSSWHYKLKDTQPTQQILKLYKELGGEIITIGSDAHKKEYVGDHFLDAKNILMNIGFKGYYTFNKMKPEFNGFED